MPQGVQARVFRLPDGLAVLVVSDLAVSILDDGVHAGRDLYRDPYPVDDVRMPADFALRVREHEAERPLRACHLPFAQDRNELGREGHYALAGGGLGAPDLLVAVSALPHM